MSNNSLLHCLSDVTMNIYSCFYFYTARDIVTVLLIFVNIYHFTYTFSHPHTEAHTQAHMYDQHTRGMATTRHGSLVGRGGRKAFVRDKGLAHNNQQTNMSNLRNIRAIGLPAKLLDYFLRSNKSNINKSTETCNLIFFEQMELPAKLLDFFL